MKTRYVGIALKNPLNVKFIPFLMALSTTSLKNFCTLKK